jgi:Alpha/beta hydrolase domain
MRINFIIVGFLLIAGSVYAQSAGKTVKNLAELPSCAEALPGKEDLIGKSSAPDECRIVSQQKVFSMQGYTFERMELRISGNVEGWAIKDGRRGNYFNDAPEIVFTQSKNPGNRLKGIGRYEGVSGHGMSLFFPTDPKRWNGKLFVMAHGAGSYGSVGTLSPRDPKADFNPLLNVNRFAGLLIDKGYAVAHTLRSAHRVGGDVMASLEDGTTLKVNVSTHAGFIVSFAKTAKNMLQAKMGHKPQKTYYYGFSAGGFLGRLVQYYAGFNRDNDGSRIFDGFILDDVGGGDWLPILMVDGKDTLLVSEEDKRGFVPQIDISHQLDVGEGEISIKKKRENAILLKQKGLAAKHRVYEIKGLAHIDAGLVSRADHVAQALDLGGIMDALVDRLDQWVVLGKEPPSSRAEIPSLGGKGEAVALPEIACPLGVYHIFPEVLGDSLRSSQETAFAAFDGVNPEPLDARGRVVDMNGNGVRDQRESVEQAWRRLGLLKANESFSRAKYVSCVTQAATALAKEGLLPTRVVNHYVRKAHSTPLNQMAR